MKRLQLPVVAVLLSWAVLVVPRGGSAENISVEPASLDFGAVELGMSSTRVLTLTSTDLTPLTIYEVRRNADVSGSFAFASAPPPPPVTLDFGESMDVQVQFAPTAPGPHAATVEIRSDALPPNHDIFVPVFGVGAGPLATAPLVSPTGAFVAGGLLALVGLVGLRRQRAKNQPR